ncbi:MAG: cyanophycin synthetase [Bacilli bacterium]
MIKKEIKAYLDRAPKRYDNASYLMFIQEVGLPALPPAIHITGTNGKGSTARYLALTLEKSGYRVGLFTSPHYLNINELTTINGVQISDAFIGAQLKKYDKQFSKYGLSSFEIMTYISFVYFAENHLDFVIIEVGMGGLLDATNIFTPILSIITNIALDHTHELGSSLIEIARHKAGIIKPNRPVLLGNIPPLALEAITQIAADKKAPIIMNRPNYSIIERSLTSIKFLYEGHNYLIGSGASYEVSNAILVINALEILHSQGIKILEGAFDQALLEDTFPGRFSVVSLNPPVVVDGAHNPHAMRALLNDLKAFNRHLVVVFAAFKDKDYAQELDLLALCGADIFVTSFDHPRAKKDYDQALSFFANHQTAIKHALSTIGEKDLLLIVGSLYFANLVTKEFQGGMYV